MKSIQVRHRFTGCTVEEFVDVYFSEAFNEAVAPHAGLKSRELVEERTDDAGLITRRTKMVPAVNVPRAIKAVMGGRDPEYVEVSVYDPEKHQASYRVESAADGFIDVGGTISFREVPGGVERVIDGFVDAKVPGLSFLIERLIRTEVEKRYNGIVKFTQDYLDAQP